MKSDYPIQPKHLDTREEPKGFSFLDHSQRVILWALVQCWQYQGNWEPFTHKEFLALIDNPAAGVNEAIRLPIIRFVELQLQAILRYDKITKDGKETVRYAPTHYLISNYFHWNPAD